MKISTHCTYFIDIFTNCDSYCKCRANVGHSYQIPQNDLSIQVVPKYLSFPLIVPISDTMRCATLEGWTIIIDLYTVWAREFVWDKYAITFTWITNQFLNSDTFFCFGSNLQKMRQITIMSSFHPKEDNDLIFDMPNSYKKKKQKYF